MVWKVYFYIPNLIGYTRIILSLICFQWAFSNYLLCAALYFTSFILDAIDGHVARALNQTSQLGAVLDMITDRFSTTILCVVLAMMYRPYLTIFNFLIALDISSHYFHMYSALLIQRKSHKDVDETKNPLLRIYYKSRKVMGVLCFGNEAFFVALYIYHFNKHLLVEYAVLAAFLPMFFKQLMNLIQLISACQTLVKVDMKMIKSF
ncbi:hypothetical protein RCL1_000362 [Eukaryota sp. TZLM3-RCL]